MLVRQYWCLETFAGQYALMEASGLAPHSSTGNLFAALSRKEPDACKAVKSAAHYLGIALASFINICDIPTIVLDGLYAQLFEYLDKPLQRMLTEHTLSSQWADIKVLRSVSTSNSVAFGAAWKGSSNFSPHRIAGKSRMMNNLDTSPLQIRRQ